MARNERHLILVSAFLALSSSVSAEAPVALHSIQNITQITFDALDLSAIAAEDVDRERDGLAPRYAIPKPVQITPAAQGTWQNLGDGMRMWRLRLSSPHVVSMNLGFSRFFMPVGGEMLVYSADRLHMLRPFTSADNESHGQLWTPPVPSDDIVIQVTLPASSLPLLDLRLTSVNLGYRGFGHRVTTVGRSGSCNVDVICPQGDAWRNEIPAIGVISTGGSTFCTGFMVNNVAQDLKPYFMTANHCGINSGNAASLVVFWNYENSTCRPPGSPASGGPGDGSLATFQTGSFFRATSSPSDFTLVELDDAPDPAWNLSFAGWDRNTGDHASAVCIHHPNTDEKRISFENDPTATASYLGTTSPGDGTHVRIIDWDLGTTEPGSSGSPLFNQNHQIIGQLHGGGAACGNNESDYFGRFSVSWNGGGTAASRLRDWLDPLNTGALTVDTISGGGMSVTPGGDVLHIGEAGGPFTSPTVTYTLTNPTPAPIDFRVSLTTSFGILLDGGTSAVTGTLAATGGTTDVVVSLGSAIDSLPPGVYVEDVVFEDITHTLSTFRRHTVEIGQTLFSVDPSSGLESGGPLGGPFTGSQLYTVTSQRPTPVSVGVSANQPWISLNGGPGPVTLNLTGTGDFDTVTVAFSAAANGLAAGIYSGSVVFLNLNDGAGDTSRSVTVDVGRIVYASTDTPRPIDDLSTLNSSVNVLDNYCIGDVNVDIDITHSYIGDLILDLRSPAGTVVRLHNRTGGSADDLLLTYDDEGVAPDGPGALSDYDFEASAGLWTLIVSDNAAQDIGTLNDWALRIAPASSVCPPQAIDTRITLPQGTAADITLGGRTTSGNPLDYIIESLPANGTLSDPQGGAIASVPHTLLARGNVVHYAPSSASRTVEGVLVRVYNFPFDFDNFDFSVNDGQPSNVARVFLASNPGWSAEGQWAFGVPTGGGSNGGDPTAGYTGLNIYGYNLNGDYPNNMSVQYLTTTVLDCSTLSNTELRFRRRLGIESSSYDHANIQVSRNGSTWTTIWTHSGSSFNESSWSLQTYNISAVADGQPTVYIRWGMGTTDGTVTYPGWNLDDIEIWGIDLSSFAQPPLPAAPPHDALKNRYISFTPNNGTTEVAFRARMITGPGATFIGWVAAPNAGGVSRLTATPVTRVWAETVVHIGDCRIVPVATYELSATVTGDVFSAPLALSTIVQPTPKFWGDTVGDFSGAWSGPNGIVNVSDFFAAVQKFQGIPSAPHATWVDVHDETPNGVVNFSDIFWIVKAFLGDAYPFVYPENCP